MDENHRDTANNHLVTTENKIWLPPSFTNGKAPVDQGQAPTQKKTNSKWGFSGKTGWDWLNLLGVLAIPFVIAAGTLFFTQQITFQQAQASERQHQTDLQIAADQQREDVLVNYQSDISDLMLNYHLASSKQVDPDRVIARAKTLTALRKLDPDRKRLLIQFLVLQSQLKGSS